MISPDGYENRRLPSFSIRHRIIRLVWNLTWFLLASWTPRYMYKWRRFLLNLFGANLHKRADVRGSARVWYPPNLTMGPRTMLAEKVNCYNMAPVLINHDTLISQGVYICAGTHDYTLASHPLVTRSIEIGPFVWVAAEAFLSPGCTVQEGCVIGARSVVNGKLQPWKVYAGNPAIAIRDRKYSKEM
jgi:putative colanic acid biosynthesis acetyltransferase WcaF